MMNRVAILFLALLSFLTFPVLSQGFSLEEFLGSLVPVIFILIFVLILLALGGVIKPRAGGVPWSLILFIVSIVLLFVVPQFIPYPAYLEVPENFKIYPLPSYAAQALGMLGLPSEWMYVPAIIYLFILPFAGIYTLVWAFLTMLKIFEGLPSNVNKVLALIVTFLTIPVGWFVKIVWIIFSFIGAWSVVIFGVMFIMALLFRGYGVVERERHEAMGRKWRAEVRRRLQNALDDIENRQYASAINEIDAASKFAGFHPDFYNKLNEAKNLLNQTPPNPDGAKNALKQALQYI